MDTQTREDGTAGRGPEHETRVDELRVSTDGRPVAPVRGRRAEDLDTARVLEWWNGFRDQLLARADELHGVGAPLVEAALTTDRLLGEAGAPAATGDVFEAMAVGFSSVAGAPALLGSWFAEFAHCCARDVGARELADAARAGLAAARRAAAPAQQGRGSLVDAMAPAADALAGADTAGVPAVVALHAAYRAAADGTRHTVDGGVVDPGALAVTWFFERGTVV